MNNLNLTKLRFTLTFAQEARLPPFAGNTVRGALGQSLCCNFSDAYDTVFKVSGGESVPNPFAVSVPYPSKGVYRTGDKLEFCVTLFGFACEYEMEIVNAAKLMCNGKLENAGLTKAERVYSREWSDAGAETIPNCDKLNLKFLTPTEILSGKEPVYEPGFATFIDSLFGRISAVIDNYGGREFVIPYSLIVKKPFVRAEYALKKARINSNNQPLCGFLGDVRYFGDVTRYLPYIDLGSQLHLGKKTTRGCGKYNFEV